MKGRDIDQLAGSRGAFLYPVPEVLGRVVVIVRFILAQPQERIAWRHGLAVRDEVSESSSRFRKTILVIINAPQPPPTSAPRGAQLHCFAVETYGIRQLVARAGDIGL